MKGKKRHDFVYRASWMIFHRFFARKFNMEYDSINTGQPPCIIIANHATNWDPVLIGLSFGRNMYYVATDHVFRMGIISKLLVYLFSPIARAKTMQETQTVITIFRRLRDKCNICIFAEGNATYDGETGEIQPSIGKLIKRAGVTLVTYRFKGSYLSFPRWARYIRKGKIEGRLVRIYSPEEIASMSENEIYEAVKKDINVSAYTDQEKDPVAFRGKKRAEYLETILYCCPECRQFSTLTSYGDILSCSCGFRVFYNEYGYFEHADGSLAKGDANSAANSGAQLPFNTITDWIKWERKEVDTFAGTLADHDRDTPVFCDDNQVLYEVERARGIIFIANGKLCLYKDRLTLKTPEKTIDFPLEKIHEMSGFAMQKIIFSTNENKLYEIHSKHIRSALKYLDMFKVIKTNASLSAPLSAPLTAPLTVKITAKE